MNEVLLDAVALKRVIPHRHPFLMLDYIASYEPGTSLSAIKAVGISDPCFAGHFPEFPIFPGALLMEALAQACAVFCRLEALGWRAGDNVVSDDGSSDIGVLGSTRMRFHSPTLPGTLLSLHVEQARLAEGKAFFDVRALSGDEVKAEGNIVVAAVSIAQLRTNGGKRP